MVDDMYTVQRAKSDAEKQRFEELRAKMEESLTEQERTDLLECRKKNRGTKRRGEANFQKARLLSLIKDINKGTISASSTE